MTEPAGLLKQIFSIPLGEERYLVYAPLKGIAFIANPPLVNKKTNKAFPAMEWLAATRDLQVMCTHIPNRGEQMVPYYGDYSNVARGKRQKAGNDDAVPVSSNRRGM